VAATGRFVATFAHQIAGTSSLPKGILLWAVVDSRTDTIGSVGLALTIRGGGTAALAALASGD
jgi:hypothetical protein